MSENKTIKTKDSVRAFLNSVENKRRLENSLVLLDLFTNITGEKPALWGTSIVGFGSYHYKYDTGREGDMPLVGFSPRKQNLTLYIMDGFDGYDRLLGKLGKHKTGKACLYINKLDDVDVAVLRELVKPSFKHMKSSNA